MQEQGARILRCGHVTLTRMENPIFLSSILNQSSHPKSSGNVLRSFNPLHNSDAGAT